MNCQATRGDAPFSKPQHITSVTESGWIVGNTCEKIAGKYVWTFFIRPATANVGDISEIVVKLHHSCRPSTIRLTAPPFEVTCRGYGPFDIRVCVQYSDAALGSTDYIYPLKFPSGDSRRCSAQHALPLQRFLPVATPAKIAASDRSSATTRVFVLNAPGMSASSVQGCYQKSLKADRDNRFVVRLIKPGAYLALTRA